MVTHEEYRISIVFHPCTGSHSLKKLAMSLGFVWDHGHQKGHRKGHHAGPGVPRDQWRYLTVVRNHWETMGSWWFRQQGQSPEATMSKAWFESWLEQHTNYHKAGRLFWFLGEIPGIEIVYFEDMENHIRHIFREYGMEFDEFPHENQSVYRDGRKTMDVMQKDCWLRIGEAFDQEIKELGYVQHFP